MARLIAFDTYSMACCMLEMHGNVAYSETGRLRGGCPRLVARASTW